LVKEDELVQRTKFDDADCPVARALDAIGGWWSLLIVRDAFDGARRFSDYQKSLGVSKGILTTRLRELVARGVLRMTPAPDGGPRQEYLLTDSGRDLFPVIVAMRQWAETHCFEPNEQRSVLVDTATGHPVARLQVCSAAGQVLDAASTSVRKVSRSGSVDGAHPLRRIRRGRAVSRRS
jgi:DNA-binding HxlR family transcriptional regulator